MECQSSGESLTDACAAKLAAPNFIAVQGEIALGSALPVTTTSKVKFDLLDLCPFVYAWVGCWMNCKSLDRLGEVPQKASNNCSWYASHGLLDHQIPRLTFLHRAFRRESRENSIEANGHSPYLSDLHLLRLDPENTFLDAANIHLHVPEGATPKVTLAEFRWVAFFPNA